MLAQMLLQKDGETIGSPRNDARVIYEGLFDENEHPVHLIVTLTGEGIILDVCDDESNEMLTTAALEINDLIEMTH